MIYWFDLFGTVIFALTGLLAAKDKKIRLVRWNGTGNGDSHWWRHFSRYYSR